MTEFNKYVFFDLDETLWNSRHNSLNIAWKRLQSSRTDLERLGGSGNV